MKFRDNFMHWFTNILPRWLVFWALIRAGAYATTGRYSNTNTSEITFLEVLNRWDKI